ncbi:MAG: EamA family transporter [Bdellovibrionota bacterium]
MWALFAACSAITQALFDVTNKKYLSYKKVDGAILGFGTFLAATLFLIPIALFNIPEQLGKEFYYLLPIAGILDAIAMFLYIKSVKMGNLGDVLPLQMTTPLFTMLFAPFLLNETITLVKALGIILIVLGIYCLNIKDIKQNFLSPIKSVLNNKASRLFLLTALIWSITTCLHKLGMKSSNTFYWLVLVKGMDFIFFYAILAFYQKTKIDNKLLKENWRAFSILGFLSATTSAFFYIAVYLGTTVYAMIIKRGSVLISIILGAILYKEVNLKEHMIGALIMLLGCFFVAI